MSNKPVTLSDEFMHKVAVRVGELIVEDFQNDPNATLEGYVPSKKFKSAVKDIMKGRDPRRKTRTLKTVLLIAAVLTTLFVCAMSVTAVRKSVCNFFLSFSSDHAVVSYQSDGVSSAPTEIETYYEPSYLPDGFEEVDRIDIDVNLKLIYSDGVYRCIYTQSLLSAKTTIDIENDALHETEVNGNQAFYSFDKNNPNDILLKWNDENYIYSLACDSPSIDIDTLIYIAESLIPTK